ncbi:MAG: hypothetical protein JXN60_06275 [Lentisphaerae bacterium]|nr:hypothetical protein [Lentisphaerota bacterium]
MYLFLTIDVETYTGDYGLDVWGHGQGLGYILEKCAEYGVQATFFVEALGVTRWGPAGVKDICDRILNAGQDVQLHLHPVVANIEGIQSDGDVFRNYSKAAQIRFITTGLNMLKECGASRVSALRIGDLAADKITLQAMRECGMKLGSNRDLDKKTTIQSGVNDLFPVRNDICEWQGIVDLPITAPRSSLPFLDGRYRHLQICAVSHAELTDALLKMSRLGYETATILTHPKEFFRRTRRAVVPDMKNRLRLEQLLSFVRGRNDMEMLPVPRCLTACNIRTSLHRDVRFRLHHSLLRMFEQGARRMQGI